ncbi:MAG: 4-(cytidine 5'-diphospho)-2-C-methyl-D-erythritol kinase [Eubacteriales bacterium]
MTTLFIKTRAKLNLSLNVLGLLENGYHDLDMVICPVSMTDEITIEENKAGIKFSCTNKEIENENNLVYKAAQKILEYAGVDKGVKIHLNKRIWTQAGLGGGSSNAAGVLIGINELYNLNLSKTQLSEIAISLGADVPLFLSDGLTRVQGIGERVEYFPYESKLYILILQGEQGLPTKDVFSLYDKNPCRKRVDNELLIKAIQENDIDEISKNMHNCLQSTAIMMNERISQSLDYLRRFGAVSSMMTGSGSAVYGIFSTKESAKDAEEKLKSEYTNCLYITTESKYIDIQKL